MTEEHTEAGWPPPYLPLPEPVVDAAGTRSYEGVTYAKIPGYRPLKLDLRVPAGNSPVPLVIWIHGGGWFEGDRAHTPPTIPSELLFGSFLAADMAVATIDYRLSFEAHFPAQLHDVKAAIRYLRAFGGEAGLDVDRIGLIGESAGGHLAALTALTGKSGLLEGSVGVPGSSGEVAAIVDWYGPSEVEALLTIPFPPEIPGMPDFPYPNPFTSMLGGERADHRERARIASPVTYVTGDAPPFLLVHGTDDRVVPYAQSEALAKALTDAGGDVTLTTIEGADHIFLGSTEVPAIVRDSVAFLARHLGLGD